ncbi:hypothetical protein [Rhizobium leguminosarum]|jgi:hypothetical protein|uniref:hypothetical protein n=1 Tax=Rhizobium leguminosarum TaxID=384 RepID=UPI00144148C5|nr:hypothetical protein [Rhizobium leguminosarum]
MSAGVSRDTVLTALWTTPSNHSTGLASNAFHPTDTRKVKGGPDPGNDIAQSDIKPEMYRLSGTRSVF